MDYYQLSSENIEEYLFSLDFIKRIEGYESLSVRDVSNGINMVFFISFEPSIHPPLILKQALPFFREHIEEKLSQRRIDMEREAYSFFAKYIAEQIPKIYYSSTLMKLIIMEFISDALPLADAFKYRIKHPTLTKDIAHFLAHTLFYSSSFFLRSHEKRELVTLFNANSDICHLTEEYIFTRRVPQERRALKSSLSDTLFKELLTTDRELQKNILELKYKFMSRSDSLIHGDFKPGAILLKEHKACVIDFEFAFVGPFGYDMGSFLYSLIAAVVSFSLYQDTEDYQEWLLESIVETYRGFESELLKIWSIDIESALTSSDSLDATLFEHYKESVIVEILQESIGFAAVQISAKMIPLLVLQESHFEQRQKRYFQIMFQISKIFLKEYKRVKSIESVIKILKSYL